MQIGFGAGPSSPIRQPRLTARAAEAALALGRRHRPDYWLPVLTFVLLAIGVIVIFSISPALSRIGGVSSNYFTVKQLIAIAIGLAAMIVAAQVPLGLWRRLAVPLLVIAAGATLLAIIMPVNPNYPAHRWVRLGSLSFQSVELLKFALMVWIAKLLGEHMRSQRDVPWSRTLKPVVIALAVIGVIVAGVQSDLGSTGVILLMVGTMLYVAGMPVKRLMLVVCAIVLLLGLSVMAMPYRRARLMTFLHPTADCQTAGYQACQAMIAVGSGGMAGLGLGSSVQAYGYLPEAANDSIFAIYAEKFGFVGVIALFGVLVALLARIKLIAERVPDDFSRLLAVGIFTWLSVQSLINIGAMIGVLPLKGITLPFISYGGTSVIFVLAAIGILFQVSHYTTFITGRQREKGERNYADSSDRRRVRGAYHPNLGSRG